MESEGGEVALPERFCLNHVNVPAVANCVQCHRPLCEACVMESGGKPFCSADCMAKYETFKARYKAAPEKEGSLLGTLIGLAVLVALVGAALFAGRWLGVGWCDAALKAAGL